MANQVLDRCESTNDLARELGETGAPHGTWVSARTQDKGRGRLGREWQSMTGNLFLSVVARIEDKSRWTWVPMTTAVAVARLMESRFPRLAVRIKWPNDLWIVPVGASPGSAGAKLGGILCEAVGNRAGSFIVIGLGLNCAHAPEGLDQATISIADAIGRDFQADEIRSEVITSLLQALQELQSSGTAGLVRDYERMAAFPPGAWLEWITPGEPSSQSQVARQGQVRALGAAGELIVTTLDGNELKLYAEDVRVRSSRRASDGFLA